MQGIEIRSYTPLDHDSYRRYITSAFHDKYILLDPTFLAWQFTELVIAVVNGEVVGQLGYRDVPYVDKDHTRVMRTLMNLHVKEEYRKSIIAGLLVREVLGNDVPMLLSGNTPTAAQLYRHIRPNLREQGNLKRFFAVLNPDHQLFNGFKIPHVLEMGTGDVALTLLTSADDIPDELWKHTRNRYGFTVDRTREYLAWRFFKHPMLSYRVLGYFDNGTLKGYCVYRIEKTKDGFSMGRIVDLVSYPESDENVVRGVIADAQNQSVHALDFMLSGRVYDEMLARTGFFETGSTAFETFPILFSPVSNAKHAIPIAYELDISLNETYLTKADIDQDRPNPH